MSAPELLGLVLAGGRSRRMGRDKSTLDYHGRPQIDIVFDLLRPLCRAVYLSNRADQALLPGHADKPQLHDRYTDLGPLGGILTAFDARPDAAWLVVACDLPFLDTETLRNLVAHRDAARAATAYRGGDEGLPEPLCAIYEPAIAERLRAFAREGIRCPRKALIRSDTGLLDLPTPHALENANAPDDLALARAALASPTRRGPLSRARSAHRECDACAPPQTTRTLTVRLYAILREAVGTPQVIVATTAATPRELYAELQAEHALPWTADAFRVAISDEFTSWDRPLRDGDVVSFIPPVAGG